MKANYNIDKELLPNDGTFDDDFFNQFQLRKGPSPLILTEDISKNYSFPTFYGDVTCSIAIFFCDYKAAQAIMPHSSYKPVKATKGRAFVILSCYEYKNVLNIPPYNEIAMTIPVMVGGGWNPPLLPLVVKGFKNFGYYVFSMPVTSYENTLRGHKIWGLPKVTEDIDMTVNGDTCTTSAYDENGTKYFELKVPTGGKSQHFDETGHLYSVLNNEILKSQTNFRGDFNINKNPALLWKQDIPTDQPALVLGDSPRASVLKQLKLTSTPFQYRYAKVMSSCFDMASERKSI
ncbi:MAG: acetoacetate decarboxylase family protein [Bacteroidetes bacterium]|nr:acetoacetate decarboxylase family protein [Bacteroidota bacterium]